MSERIRRNFLLVEFDEGSKNKEVVEHDIQLENNKVIRINKITIEEISDSEYITPSKEENVLVYNVIKGNIVLED